MATHTFPPLSLSLSLPLLLLLILTPSITAVPAIPTLLHPATTTTTSSSSSSEAPIYELSSDGKSITGPPPSSKTYDLSDALAAPAIPIRFPRSTTVLMDNRPASTSLLNATIVAHRSKSVRIVIRIGGDPGLYGDAAMTCGDMIIAIHLLADGITLTPVSVKFHPRLFYSDGNEQPSFVVPPWGKETKGKSTGMMTNGGGGRRRWWRKKQNDDSDTEPSAMSGRQWSSFNTQTEPSEPRDYSCADSRATPLEIRVAIAFDAAFCKQHDNEQGAIASVNTLLRSSEEIFSKSGLCVRLSLVHIDGHCTSSSDPYRSLTGKGTDVMLDRFVDMWTDSGSSYPKIDRDVAFFLTSRSGSSTAGRAYIGVVCSDNYGYGVCQGDSLGVFTHEVGHTLGANHASTGIMKNFLTSGTTMEFSNPSKNQIAKYVDEQAMCLKPMEGGNGDNGNNVPVPTPNSSSSSSPMPSMSPSAIPSFSNTPSASAFLPSPSSSTSAFPSFSNMPSMSSFPSSSSSPAAASMSPSSSMEPSQTSFPSLSSFPSESMMMPTLTPTPSTSATPLFVAPLPSEQLMTPLPSLSAFPSESMMMMMPTTTPTPSASDTTPLFVTPFPSASSSPSSEQPSMTPFPSFTSFAMMTMSVIPTASPNETPSMTPVGFLQSPSASASDDAPSSGDQGNDQPRRRRRSETPSPPSSMPEGPLPMMPTVQASQEPSMTKDRDMPPFETDPSSMDMDMTMSPEPSMTSLSGMDMDMDTDDGDNGDDEVNNQDNGSLIPYDSVLSQSARPGSCAASLSATSALACTRFTHVGDMETLFGSVSVRVRQANNMFEVRFNSPGDDTSITLAVVRLGDASSKTVRESSMMRKAVTLKIDPTQIDGMCCSVDGSGKRIDVSVAVVVAQRGEHSSGKMETMRFKSGMGRFRLNVACVNACGSWSNSGFGSSMVDLIGGLTGSNGQEGMQEQQSGEVMLTQQGCPVCVG